jgi:hypothetical protein
MSKTTRAILVLGMVVVMISGMALLGHRSSSAKSLRQYRAQLKTKGETLALADFDRSRSKLTNDSLMVLTNAANALSEHRFSPDNLQYLKFMGPGRVALIWQQEAPRWKGASPRKVITWQEIEAEVDSAMTVLDHIRQAMKAPAPHMGSASHFFAGPRPFVSIRTAAQWLAAATVTEVRRRNLEEALKNIEALAGVARLHHEHGTLVTQMIRVSVAGLGLAVTWEALQAPGWDAAQLERLQRAWDTLDLVSALYTGFLGDRAMGLECFGMLREKPSGQVRRTLQLGPTAEWGALFQDYAFLPAYKLSSINDDELLYLETMQGVIDSIRLLQQRRSWSAARTEQAESLPDTIK